MYSNFTEETCTGTGNTLALAGATTGRIQFSKSFSDGDLVAYVLEDSGGTIKVAGIGAYVSATDDITRNDIWNWNGTAIDNNPSTNITLSGGTHTVRCDIIDKNAGGFNPIETWLYDSNYWDIGDNLIQTGSADTAVVADQCSYLPVRLDRPRYVTDMSVYVSTADAGVTKSRIGIYNTTVGGAPGDLITSDSLGTLGTANLHSVTLTTPQYLAAGMYFMAFVCDGTPTMKVSKISETGSTTIGISATNTRKYIPYEALTSWSDVPATATPIMGINSAPLCYFK